MIPKAKVHNFIRTSLLHPFIFAIYPTLFLFTSNITQLDYPVLFFPFAALLLAASISLLFWRRLSKDWQKAAIITSTIFLIFFSYGPITNLLLDIVGRDFLRGLLKPRFFLPFWGLLIAASSYAVIRVDRFIGALNHLLNSMAIILILVSLLNIATYEARTMSAARQGVDSGQSSVSLSQGGAESLPDIYYIVPDAYASEETLREIYGFSNEEFLDFLESKGFYISAERSNYVMTFLSLAANLNMRYLDDLPNILGADTKDETLPYKMIDDNEVTRILRDRGYKYIHFSSGWGPTNSGKNADLNIQYGFLNEFTVKALRMTMLAPFEFTPPLMRARITTTFDWLNEMSQVAGPKFVFAHILMPHPPWLFDSEGNPVDAGPVRYFRDVWDQKEHYVDHVKFANKRLIEVVNNILSSSNRPVIIIIQADHGTASTSEDEGVLHYKERHGILNAYYFPEGKAQKLNRSISPVNMFRLVFNKYLGGDYELLEDKNYYSTLERPYLFIDVTEKVNASQ